MSFYQELSRYYDEVFPVDATEMAFVGKQVDGRKRLLDIGCGTGNKTVHCSERVGEVLAFDRDEGMIQKAMADNARPNIAYEVLDMAAVGTRFSRNSFDAALCLGNTLVHLEGRDSIYGVLEQIYGLLVSKAVFVIQILNYDRILDQDIRELPSLETEHVSFSREYRREGERLHFITGICLKATGVRFDNDVLLYPLRKDELSGMLADIGFASAVWYGSYQGTPPEPSSFAAIAVCEK